MQVRIDKAYLEGENRLLKEFGCPSAVQPRLQISGTTATQFAVTLIDISTKPKQFVHWMAWNWNYPALDAVVTGVNERGTNTYLPPCPPEAAGDHEYVFTVYAQREPLHLDPRTTTLQQLQQAVEGLPSATTSMVYARCRCK